LNSFDELNNIENDLERKEIILCQNNIINQSQLLDHVKNNSRGEVIHLSAYPTLDDTLNGIETGEVIVLAGATGNGKTTFARSLTHYFSDINNPPLWFSLEMTPYRLLNSFGGQIPKFYVPKIIPRNININWIEDHIIEAKEKYGVHIAIIDHLHYIVDFAVIRNSISLAIGDTMRQLKLMAERHNIIIILIAHTTKVRFDNKPDISDIRDSSFIQQEADTVLMIWRKAIFNDNEFKEYTSDCKIGVFKNRRIGTLKTIKMYYNYNLERIVEESC